MASNKTDKEFKISSWSIDHKTVIYVLIAICLIGGVSSYISMPRESFPEITQTKVYISSLYPGNTAEDVERLITDPLEKAIKSVSNIDKTTSSSQEDYSMIIIDFDENIEVADALAKVKDKVDAEKAKTEWPIFNGSKLEPSVFDINFSEQVPIMNINLQGNYKTIQLKEYAENLKDYIEAVSDIKEVNIRGVQDLEVEVAVDIDKMMASRVSFDNVINAIKAGNSTMSAGNIIASEQRKTIRILGEIQQPEDLGNFVVKTDGGVVYLRDVASISFKEKDATTKAREFGKNVVMLDVKKNAGTNLIEVTNKVKDVLKKAQQDYLPSDINVSITNDQSRQTLDQVNDLINNIIFGVILVVGVLMFFLGFRNALFVGIAIPLSMTISFMVLNILGYSLNTMVLFALVMGLGMLVDNGVVVVENVYRLMSEEGMDRISATKKGIGEIAIPIIISTATTVAAFLPLGFWPGIMGEFMIYFPITLSVVLSSSLFVALLMNSVFISRFMKVHEENLSKKRLIKISLISGVIGLFMFLLGAITLGNLIFFFTLMLWLYKYYIKGLTERFQNLFLVISENKYKKFLTYALRGKNPYWFLGGTFGLLVLSFILLGIRAPKVEFFPNNKPKQIIVYIEYPQGTAIEKTNRTTKKIEAQVYKVLNEKEYLYKGKNFMVKSAIAQVGEGSGNPLVDGSGSVEMPHRAKIMVHLVDFKYRKGEDSEILRMKIQKALKNKYPGVAISVEKDAVGPPAGYPINIEIKGENYDKLLKCAKQMSRFINSKSVPGVEEIKIDVSRDKPVEQIIIDREKAGELGISVTQVALQLRRSLFGEKAETYKHKGENYDINVRFNKEARYDKMKLYNQRIIFRDPANGRIKEVPVISVIKTESGTSFSAIKHINNQRVVTIYSPVLAGFNANEVVNHIKNYLKEFEMPDNLNYKFTGEIEEQGKQMSFLLKALFFGLMLILLLLVLQFNSISKPIIIFVAILLSFIGVLLGLVIFNMTFVIMMTMLGIVSLAGVVVNNGVVLLDYTQILINRRREKLNLKPNELLSIEDIKMAIIDSGKSRLRPVLLTAVTTVLGLIPLAIGLNINFETLFSEYNPDIYLGGDNVIFWGPLSWTVIFGLTFATFLTLVIVPVTFFIVTKIKMKLINKQ